MARPLDGYSENGVTLTDPASVPGSADADPGDGDRDTPSPGSSAVNETTRAPAASLMPAMPPPDRPCGRTWPAPKCSSWQSLVTKHSASSPVRSSTAPTTSSPSLSEMTSQSSLAERYSGFTRFTTPCLVPSARPGEPGSKPVSASTRSPSRVRNSPTGAPPCRLGWLAVLGQRRQVEDAELDHPASRR